MTRHPSLAGAAAVDVHAHLVPVRAAELLGRPDLLAVDPGTDAARLVIRGRAMAMPVALVDGGAFVANAAGRGVAVSLASVPPFMYQYDLEPADALRWAASLNDALLEEQRLSGGAVLAVATLPMRQPVAAAGEVDRVANEGAAALTIATYPGTWIDDPVLDPVWRAAARHDLPVLLHPHHVDGRYGDEAHHLRNTVGNPFETSFAQARLVFSDWLVRHPTVRVCLSHAGGGLAGLLGRWRHAAAFRHGVTPGDPDWPSRFYYDTICFDDRILRHLVELVGAERVAYGSDTPFDMADTRGVRDVVAPLGGDERQLVRSANARAWLGG